MGAARRWCVTRTIGVVGNEGLQQQMMLPLLEAGVAKG